MQPDVAHSHMVADLGYSAGRRIERRSSSLPMNTPLSAAAAALARSQAQRATQQYQQAKTLTVSPGQLVILMYEGALRFLRQAHQAVDAGQMEMAHTSICRVQDILAELDATLDDKGGAVAVNLHRVYDYCLRRLITANVAKDAAIIVEVIGHIEPLLDVWREAVAAVETTGTSGLANGTPVHLAKAG